MSDPRLPPTPFHHDLPAGVPLEAVLDHLPGALGYWDAECRNRLANATYVDWFGVTPGELDGRHIAELLGPELYERNRPHIEAALRGEPQLFERTLLDTAGRVRAVQVSYIPDVRDGRVHGFLALATDISGRVAAERERERSIALYRAVAGSIPDGFVFVFDHDLRYLVAEGPALAELGYNGAALEGRALRDVVPAALAAQLEPRYRAALAGRSTTWERRRGARIFRLTAGPVLADGEVFAGMVVGTDVTELHHGELLNRALGDIATAVARNASPAAVFGQVAESVRDLFGAETATVARFDGHDRVTLAALASLNPPPVDPVLTFQEGDERRSALAAVARTGRAALVRYDEGGEIPASMRAAGLAGGVAAPIRVRDRLWGALGLALSDPERLDGSVVDKLAAFAELVALAIGNADMLDALTRDAVTDPLTGAANHRAFHERLRDELAIARRHRRPLSVVLLDVDHFKRVNDTHGHLAGDTVLGELAERLRTGTRRGELVARVGGEEFGWILPDTDEARAHAAAERVREAIATEPVEPVGRVTVSLGVCTLAPGGEGDADGLLDAADRALYAAKAAGRNATRAARCAAATRAATAATTAR